MKQPEERWITKKVREIRCGWCGEWFEPAQPHARFCSTSHRVMAHRKAKKAASRTPAALKPKPPRSR